MPDPVLYGPHFSTYVRSTRLALEEKSVAYRLEATDVFGDPKAKAAHLSRHPFGKIPAFAHDGFTLYETSAIMRYVDEAFPGPRLQPSEARDRAHNNSGSPGPPGRLGFGSPAESADGENPCAPA